MLNRLHVCTLTSGLYNLQIKVQDVKSCVRSVNWLFHIKVIL